MSSFDFKVFEEMSKSSDKGYLKDGPFIPWFDNFPSPVTRIEYDLKIKNLSTFTNSANFKSKWLWNEGL